MRIGRRILAVFLAAWLAAPPAGAEPPASVVGREALDEALRAHAARVKADREAIARVLERQEVRDVASRFGIEMARVEAAAALLDDEEAAQVAERARAVESALAGGQNFTINATTVIIILLVVILIIVAVD